MNFKAYYKLDICYRQGKANTIPDSLFKPPCGSPLAPLRLARASIVESGGASQAADQQATRLELESLEQLDTIIVEPERLGQVYEVKTDPYNSEMVRI